MPYSFALIWAWWYIAPRHMKAISETWNILVAALDKNDSVGIIDSHFPQADFFTEFEIFDRHLEKLKRNGKKIDYVSICTPNYLHDAHMRFALRIWAHAICEKPLVLNPWNIDALQEIEKESDKKVYTILQLRLHPVIKQLKEQIDKEKKQKNWKYTVDLCYITPRGKWYDVSWKGNISKSGGIATNIWVHFFDMLSRIFGNVEKNTVNVLDDHKAAWYLELEHANVRWFLSIDAKDLPKEVVEKKQKSYRSILIEWKELEFSEWFTDLHTESYREILAWRGFGLEDSKNSIQIVHDIRNQKPVWLVWEYHPFLKNNT